MVDYKPNEIGKPIPFIIKTFTIVSYDPTTGIVTMPEMIEYKYLNAGMLSVDPSTGDAANIIEVLGSNQYLIAKNLTISNEQAIIPQYPLYRARLESASFSEDYTIGIHCSGDPLWAIYLHSIVSYSLLRYRESLLEREGFQISSISSSDYSKNAQYESIGEHIYSRYITLTGQVQNNWVKAPQRFVESIVFQDPNSIDPAGIKIISSNRLPGADSQNDLWSSVSDNDDSINDNDDDDPFWKS